MSSGKWRPFCLGLNVLRGGMGVLGVIFNKYLIFELFTENNSLLLGL